MPAAHDHDALRDSLRHGKLRITAVRLAVMQALAESPVALEAAEVAAAVAAAGEEADRVTIYRTLNALVDSGIAHRVDPGDRIFRFSLTDHGRCSEAHHEHEHPHMVCDSCGAVECILDAEVIITPHQGANSRRSFKVTQQDIMLHGTCDRCAGGDAAARPRRR